MARYTEADCRLCRREGCKLYLKGDKCNSPKCTLIKKANPPGMHTKSRKKASGYSIQLREKQKTKRIYGLSEKQMRTYYEKATLLRGITGENLLVMLERRLDNVVYRMGFASSRDMARQMVTHGHFTINGKNVDIPSIQVKIGDIIAVRETKKDKPMWKEIKDVKNLSIVKWLQYDNAGLTGKVLSFPEREEIDLDIKEHLIVELYSK